MTLSVAFTALVANADGASSTSKNDSSWVPSLIGTIGPLLALIGVMYQTRKGRKDAIERLRASVDIYPLLPEDGSSRPDMQHFIELQIQSIDARARHVRDPMDLTLGPAFVVSGGFLAYFTITRGSYWYFLSVVAFVMIALGLTGLARGLSKPRPAGSSAASKNNGPPTV